METPTNYRVAPHSTKSRMGVLTSPYCATVKEFMLAMISSGYVYKSEAQLCDMAIAFTDRLIERVGEKL